MAEQQMHGGKRMKILHIIDSLSMGGAENVLIGLSSGQKRLGHDVTIMPLVCPPQTPVRSKIEDNNVLVAPFLERGSVYNPRLIFKIAKVLKNYDLVHVHLFPALYWAFYAKVLSCCRVPMIYTEHSTNNKRRNNALLHCMDSLVYQHGYKMIVACAEKVLDTYKKAFPKVKHTCYINNGVETSLYANAKSYTKNELLEVSDEIFLITMVARFMSMKRQDTIVEALIKLPSDVHAVFVGGNEEDEGLRRVKNLAETNGVLDRVHFLYVRDDVPRILKTSDVIIMASDYEGLSLSSIEGMAAGKPFIASDVNGLREVVGGAGLLFENKNADALADLIIKLKTQPDYYFQISHACEARSKEFDVNAMVESYLQVYNALI